jgi:hypothetical protein
MPLSWLPPKRKNRWPKSNGKLASDCPESPYPILIIPNRHLRVAANRSATGKGKAQRIQGDHGQARRTPGRSRRVLISLRPAGLALDGRIHIELLIGAAVTLGFTPILFLILERMEANGEVSLPVLLLPVYLALGKSGIAGVMVAAALAMIIGAFKMRATKARQRSADRTPSRRDVMEKARESGPESYAVTDAKRDKTYV